MAGDFSNDFSSDFGDGRPPRTIQEIPPGAFPGLVTVGRGWTIWVVDRQSPFGENSSYAEIAEATKRYQVIRVRDVYHDIKPSQNIYNVLNSGQYVVQEFDSFSDAQNAFVADSLTYAKQVRKLGIGGLFE